MTPTALAAIALVGAAALAAVATGVALRWLRRLQVLDLPNHRSSHTVPTPRGGGWGMVVVVLPVLWLAGGVVDGVPWRICAVAGAGLVVCSWLDDRKGLSPQVRFGTQAAAVIAVIAMLDGPVIPGVPWLVDRALVTVAWLWFINLYNFMDGIDGIAGVETATIGLGAMAIALLGATPAVPAFVPAAIAGAAAGFLWWNWSPARVFMGDVGSVPLGFALGFLLILIAAAGHWPAALVLPAYFAYDATATLLRRLAARERVWEAHREHLYQRAVAAGRSHAWVATRVLVADLLLAGLAIASVRLSWWVVPPAAVVLAALVVTLRKATSR